VSDTDAILTDYYSGAICRMTVYLHTCAQQTSMLLPLNFHIAIFILEWEKKNVGSITFWATFVSHLHVQKNPVSCALGSFLKDEPKSECKTNSKHPSVKFKYGAVWCSAFHTILILEPHEM